LKKQIQGTEKKIGNNLDRLNHLADKAKNVWDQTSQLARKLGSDRRTYFIAGGVVLGFILLRIFVGKGEKPNMQRFSKYVPVAITQKRSLGYELFQTIIQTFVLHYARKLLTEFLEKQRKQLQSAIKN